MVVVWIKRDRFPMKLLQVLIPGKVYEYEYADLLIVRKDCHHFTIEAHRGNPSYEKAIAIEVAMMRITKIDAVPRFVHHAFSGRRNKAPVLQEVPLRGLTTVQLQQKTISYQNIFSFCYNMCPSYAWMWSPCRFPAAYHTTSKVSGIDRRVKSGRVGSLRNFMLISEASWQAVELMGL